MVGQGSLGMACRPRLAPDHGSFRGPNPTRVAEHDVSLGIADYRAVSLRQTGRL